MWLLEATVSSFLHFLAMFKWFSSTWALSSDSPCTCALCLSQMLHSFLRTCPLWQLPFVHCSPTIWTELISCSDLLCSFQKTHSLSISEYFFFISENWGQTTYIKYQTIPKKKYYNYHHVLWKRCTKTMSCTNTETQSDEENLVNSDIKKTNKCIINGMV